MLDIERPIRTVSLCAFRGSIEDAVAAEASQYGLAAAERVGEAKGF